MQLTPSRWSNNLAVRIPAGKAARANWLQNHFSQVNARLAEHPLTTPSTQLLREEERY